MAKISVTVCDICEQVGAPTRRYRISKGAGSSRVFELCAEHAAPLQALLERDKGGSGSVRRFVDAVVTIDQLEALKASGKA